MTNEVNPWDVDAPTPTTKQKTSKTKEVVQTTSVAPAAINAGEFDLGGLEQDFPTATELERFVYDETGVVLSLKGRANKLKYQVAMDVLNGNSVDQKFIGTDNPYIDRTELVPEEPMKIVPQRDKSLPGLNEIQNQFYSPVVPHPEPDQRAQDKKVHMLFRKYKNGMISYEILGPLEQHPHGSKIDKYGRNRPEVMKWVDPRTGEQVVVREDGTLTTQGKRLRAMMQTMKVNTSNFWETWIDREFVSLDGSVASNPWLS